MWAASLVEHNNNTVILTHQCTELEQSVGKRATGKCQKNTRTGGGNSKGLDSGASDLHICKSGNTSSCQKRQYDKWAEFTSCKVNHYWSKTCESIIEATDQ
jgi:hypothetical protein